MGARFAENSRVRSDAWGERVTVVVGFEPDDVVACAVDEDIAAGWKYADRDRPGTGVGEGVCGGGDYAVAYFAACGVEGVVVEQDDLDAVCGLRRRCGGGR